jgi:hypothetical protein
MAMPRRMVGLIHCDLESVYGPFGHVRSTGLKLSHDNTIDKPKTALRTFARFLGALGRLLDSAACTGFSSLFRLPERKARLPHPLLMLGTEKRNPYEMQQ